MIGDLIDWGICLASVWLLQGVEIERLGSHSVTYGEEKAANYWARGGNGKDESQLKETGKLRKLCCCTHFSVEICEPGHRRNKSRKNKVINPHVYTRHTRNRGFMQGNRTC